MRLSEGGMGWDDGGREGGREGGRTWLLPSSVSFLQYSSRASWTEWMVVVSLAPNGCVCVCERERERERGWVSE